MALRSLFAIDNETLVVSSSSNGSIVGDPIINNSDTPDGTIFTFGGGPIREVIVDDTAGRRGRLEDDEPSGHIVEDGAGLVADGTPIESESLFVLRELDSNGNPFGPEIEINVFSQNGVTSDIWGIGLTEPLNPGSSYIKVSGSNTGTSRYRDFIACFTFGTLIKTPKGRVPVEEIRVGQMVWTKDAGPQPVQWVDTTTVPGAGDLAPVRFEAGVLGNTRDLLVSPQHRIWIQNALAELYFGHKAVLVAAKHLCGLPGVRQVQMDTVQYAHFMFDGHQIVNSNGALTESFFLAANGISALDEGPRAELRKLFPSLAEGIEKFGETAAPTLTGRETRALRLHLSA